MKVISGIYRVICAIGVMERWEGEVNITFAVEMRFSLA